MEDTRSKLTPKQRAKADWDDVKTNAKMRKAEEKKKDPRNPKEVERRVKHTNEQIAKQNAALKKNGEK